MDRKLNLAAVIIIAIVVIAAIILLLPARGPVRHDSGVHLTMGTFAQVVAIAPGRAAAVKSVEAAIAEIENVNDLMSDYKEDSEISKVNREAFKNPVKVSESTFEVIRKSVEFSEFTDGAFDITVGPLVALFRGAKKSGVASTAEQIADAKARVGYEKLVLNEADQTIRFTVDGMSLDLGGIAKGYAVDKAVEAMRRNGALGGMVDIGGDVRCFGTPPEGRQTWVIGLQDPNIEDGGSGLRLYLKITDAAVTTSGDYQQFAVIDGERQSHILDRETGKGAQGLSSVTIIASNAADADALSTAATVLGPEEALPLIEGIDETEAILISPAPDYEITKTSGADKFIRE